jgi:hypothetical protein
MPDRTTTAAEKLTSALQHVRAAVKDLSAIVVDECDGLDGLRHDEIEALDKLLIRLVKIRKALDEIQPD